MHIRTFRAANLNAALEMIRLQMGPDATVLHTRQVASSGLRFLRRAQVEVTAGLRHSSVKAPARSRAPEDPLAQQLGNLGLPPATVHNWLEHVARTLPETEGGEVNVRGREDELLNWLETRIPLARPIDVSGQSRRIVALVGATGVGKTTTIAKLAGQYCLDKKSRVGLLTVDAFRAAAVDQINAFATALKIPLEVVRSIEDLQPALARIGDVDLLLVDTVGQSPRGPVRVKHLADLLERLEPDETHLVLDANSSSMTARDCLSAFSIFSPTALILSKVDEVCSAAPVIAAAIEGMTGFSYITNGQSVPRDIELADSAMLSKLVSGIALQGPGSVISIPEKSA